MIKVAFLDRDGVINDDTGHYYIYKFEDFKLNKGIIEGLLLLKDKGFKFIVITNQGGIAQGTYSKNDVEIVHQKMKDLLAEQGIDLLDIFYCPHHNKFEQCLCRKPAPLMIEKAIARYEVDKKASFLIGDNIKDVQAAENAGIKGYKIETNQNIVPLIHEILNE